MKLHVVLSTCFLTQIFSCLADESDKQIPAVVANAKTKVEVLMKYTKSTGQCFPDPDTKVRFHSGKVLLTDFKLYKNREPRFSEGLVAFKLEEKWGACDKSGKVVLPAIYESGFTFHEGLAGVERGGKYGFIDKKGKWIIEPKFDSKYTRGFIGNACAVYVAEKGAVIDRKGNYIWKPGLLRSETLAGGIFIQTADNRKGFLDDSGNLIPNGAPNSRYYKGK